ncbi:MAG: DUF885 domain-containing protein [Xanthomonadales bacterium]|nr:DUF885 domain-containing protein [Xanthomonadales bacterium]
MRRLLRWFFRGGLLLTLLLGIVVVHEWNFRPWSLRVFYERVFVQFAVESPQMLSSMRMLPSWLDWYSDDLDDVALAQGERMRQKLFADRATLASYDRNELDAEGQLSYDVLDYFLAMQAEGDPFRFHDYPANQLSGFQTGLPSYLASQHPVRSLADAEDYLARLSQFDRYFAQQMEGVRLRIDEHHIVPPRFVVEKVLAETREFVAAKPEDNVLYASFAEKLDKIQPPLPAAERQRLLDGARERIERVVYPAYRTLIEHHEALLPKARPNNGVWDLPQGPEFYAWAVRMHTTTDMSPADVHALGLAEVARIEAEMDAILRGEGLLEGSNGTRVRQIAERPDQLYPDSDEGRAQIIADYQAILDEIDGGLAPHFGLRPSTGVKVERVPVFRQKTAPGAYYEPPAFDGSRPGTFFANLREVGEIPRFSMRTLAYHEGIPGHHFQIGIQQGMEGPMFRKLLPFTAFAEGWALYAERLASEMGFQRTPLDNLGRLQAEMFRAVRLVVDTGMHDQRWTREQAIAYMIDKTGMSETDVVAEIERYLVNPGQALAYKVGMNTLLRLRDEARAELGERFDAKAFHDLVLGGGSLPLTLLERRVDAWVATRKASA